MPPGFRPARSFISAPALMRTASSTDSYSNGFFRVGGEYRHEIGEENAIDRASDFQLIRLVFGIAGRRSI